MSDSRSKALTRAAWELAPSPLKAFAGLLGAALGRPDLEHETIATLQADVVRLYQRIETVLSELADEVKAKVDPIEALELVTQTVSNMGRTAQQEKRTLMGNVLVAGLTDPDTEILERRLFVRAVADLEPDHVRLLVRIRDAHGRHSLLGMKSARVAHEQTLVGELELRGFLKREETIKPGRARFGEKEPAYDLKVDHAITPLGKRFLIYVDAPPPPDKPKQPSMRPRVVRTPK